MKTPVRNPADPADGFDAVTTSSPGGVARGGAEDIKAALTALKRVKSIRGHARSEYGKLYQSLGRYYIDAVTTDSPMECLIFRVYTLPEQQAQMLSQVRQFAKSDPSPGSTSREERLTEMVTLFDTCALLEFRKGYEYKDIQGRMRQYAHVMHALNGGQSSVELYLHDNRLITQKASLGSASDCVDYSMGYGQISLQRTHAFFDRLANSYTEESAIVDKVFPSPQEVQLALLKTVADKVLAPFLTSLFDEAHSRGIPTYLRTVSGAFAQTREFIQEYATPNGVKDEDRKEYSMILSKIFEPHLDLYLAEESSSFQQKANSEVNQFDRALSDQVASTESFLMSNVNRQADKKDFMSSFKKVVMMPVNILPSFSSSATQKSTAKALVNGEIDSSPSTVPTRSSTPTPGANPLPDGRSSTAFPTEAPSNELAAKAALMTTKLENIRSLFSIEVALNLVHATKSSLERVAQFITLGDAAGEAARQQCASMFVLLLHSVGARHVKAGFDKAIDHLSAYNAREANANADANRATAASSQVAPLATFLELVNVGDLIQQMLDVFYESELVRLKISNRDDFLDPAVKAKKAFEATLDERVAAGLGKGIDVLMDEVEFIAATTQLPTDFNPVVSQGNETFDIGPSSTAKKVVALVGHHTGMLTGAAEKTLLDVFTAEVGLRLFTTLTKHLKRQRISTIGAMPLLSDLSLYSNFIAGFKNTDLNSYYSALRAVGQIYLIDGSHANEMATIIADGERYRGVFTVEEVLEFAERRADWLSGGVRAGVEKAMYGQGCSVM